MKQITLSAVTVLSLAGGFSSTLSADDFTLFSNAKFNGEVKARYEGVDDQNNAVQQANAYTVRLMLGLEANLLGIDGLTMKVDGTTVQTLGGTKYNDLSATKFTNYDVVADPEQTRFTQAYLQYKMGATSAKVGRQLTNLDAQRFIGSVDWRQMPLSLDAVSIANTSVPGLYLYGAYVYSYETIFNERTYDSKSIILNGSYKVSDMLKITAYDYMLSLERGQFAADTYGISLTGDIPAGPLKISYHGEYAKQTDATFATTTTNIKTQNDATYYNIEATASMMGVSLGAGQELLSGTSGSDGKTKFQTPLATLHKFNGTADMFLVTPTGGLIDTYATVGYGAAGLGKALATYHTFKTDVAMGGKSDLGHELDLQYSNAIPGVKGLNGLLKAAFYTAGDVTGYTKDKDILWIELDYKF
ncbi:MAG: alginate export family protein [Epsilonproteobacteria bacterium]|nr:alginate export family protein [Campylobacterota bacterium]